jgi:hypothetical protein
VYALDDQRRFVDTSIATGITSLTYTNTGLTKGTTYYYYFTATNCKGTSANSSHGVRHVAVSEIEKRTCTTARRDRFWSPRAALACGAVERFRRVYI